MKKAIGSADSANYNEVEAEWLSKKLCQVVLKKK